MWVAEFSNFFIPRVDELLAEKGNYQIEWMEAYGGQIVKPRGVLEGIKLGLGDIGIVTTIFHNSALPSQGMCRAGGGKSGLPGDRRCAGHLPDVLDETAQLSG